MYYLINVTLCFDLGNMRAAYCGSHPRCNMKLFVYIDAFSFYYGITRPTKYKWCDLFLLSQLLFPNDQIEKVKLFSGRSRPSKNNPNAHSKQELYFRALRTNPRIDIFSYKNQEGIRKYPINWFYKRKIHIKINVHYFQEKRVDVSLTANMCLDAHKDYYDAAVLMTNDTDFLDAINTVTQGFNKPVFFVPTVFMGSRPINQQLVGASTSQKYIDERILADAQLKDRIETKNHQFINKPREWF